MESQKRHGAVVLAAGKGSRMKSDVPKQFMKLAGKPLIYYALKTFQDSFIDDIVLVTGADQMEYCRREIVDKYGFSKVRKIVSGGKERYDSVFCGLQELADCDYIYIHDGARPMVSEDILQRGRECVQQYRACVAGMPSKDTVKIVNDRQEVTATPSRANVWTVQTPQIFEGGLIREAYTALYTLEDRSDVTDDAMVVEKMMGVPVHVFQGSYYNIKVTTPEDIGVAETMMRELENGRNTGK